MVLSRCPSSTPENSAWSLFLSKTCTFLMAPAGMFWVAILGSLLKNFLPFTNICFTCSPCAFTLPSLSTSTPGSFFNKSSPVALGCTLNAAASNSVVSFLKVTALRCPVTTAASSILLRDTIRMAPASSVSALKSFGMSCKNGS